MHTAQFQLLLEAVAGWVNRNQQDVIEYLREENRVLHDQLGGRGLLFTDAQRRRLAAKAKQVRRKDLFGVTTLVTSDTLLRWYRRLIAQKYDGSRARRPGRSETAAAYWAFPQHVQRSKLQTMIRVGVDLELWPLEEQLTQRNPRWMKGKRYEQGNDSL